MSFRYSKLLPSFLLFFSIYGTSPLSASDSLQQEGGCTSTSSHGGLSFPVPGDPSSHKRLILSLDGGGIRGVIEVSVLCALEEYINTQLQKRFPQAPPEDIRLAECFDLIAGTSTGGIIALLMGVKDPTTGRPRYKMKEIAPLYERYGSIIFPPKSKFSGLFKTKYSCEPLEALIAEYFTEETLHDLYRPTLITAYDAHQESAYLFKSHDADQPSKNYKLKDIARATSAAPTYLPAAEVTSMDDQKHLFMDGGVTINNPSLHAYLEAQTLYPNDRFHIVSLGTGLANLFTLESKGDKGVLYWAKSISTVLMDSGSRAIDDLLARSIRLRNDSYTRFQPHLDQRLADLDNSTPENIASLKGLVRAELHKIDSSLREIEQELYRFYEAREFYIFHPLVKKVQAQQPSTTLSLEKEILNPRSLWEVGNYLEKHAIRIYDLRLNHTALNPAIIVQLNMFHYLTALHVDNTNLGLEELEAIKKLGLTFESLSAKNNPRLAEITEPEVLINLLSPYELYHLDYPLHIKLAQYYKRQRNLVKAKNILLTNSNPKCCLELGQIYLEEDTEEGFRRGIETLLPLARAEDSEAQAILGRLWEYPSEALLEYARHNDDLTDTEKKAEYWYKLAALKGHKRAAKTLGGLYERGTIKVPIPQGGTYDERYQLQQALKYLRIAQESGSTVLDERIKNLEQRIQQL